MVHEIPDEFQVFESPVRKIPEEGKFTSPPSNGQRTCQMPPGIRLNSHGSRISKKGFLPISLIYTYQMEKYTY